MYSLGMDIGYSSVKFTLLNNEDEIIYNKYELHGGYVREQVEAILKDLSDRFDVNKNTKKESTAAL